MGRLYRPASADVKVIVARGLFGEVNGPIRKNLLTLRQAYCYVAVTIIAERPAQRRARYIKTSRALKRLDD